MIRIGWDLVAFPKLLNGPSNELLLKPAKRQRHSISRVALASPIECAFKVAAAFRENVVMEHGTLGAVARGGGGSGVA